MCFKGIFLILGLPIINSMALSVLDRPVLIIWWFGSTFLPLTLPCRRSGTSNIGFVCVFGMAACGCVSLPEKRVSSERAFAPSARLRSLMDASNALLHSQMRFRFWKCFRRGKNFKSTQRRVFIRSIKAHQHAAWLKMKLKTRQPWAPRLQRSFLL